MNTVEELSGWKLHLNSVAIVLTLLVAVALWLSPFAWITYCILNP